MKKPIFAITAILTCCLPASAHEIVLRVSGVRSTKGSVVALLYSDKSAFPTKPERSLMRVKAMSNPAGTELKFENVPNGIYAVTVYHDENDNGKLDANFIGIPKEGVGASRDPKPRMGPPRFDDAKVEIGSSQTLDIALRY